MPSDGVPRVGVTGGIGSGKSEVCRRFERLGRTVLSADTIAREIMEHDAGVRRRLEETFGPVAYSADGTLRRKELASLIFADPRARARMNALVHPFVFREIDRRIAALTTFPPYVVIEAALIYESRMDRRLDAVVVVRANEPVRRARIIARDHLTDAEVSARMKAQRGNEAGARHADFFIDNNSSLKELGEKTALIDRILLSLFASRSGFRR
jgi:dephospho-CoA kinase